MAVDKAPWSPMRAGIASRILCKEERKRRRTSPRERDPEERRFDDLILDLGMMPVPILDMKTLREESDQLCADCHLACGCTTRLML
jgi:hypothetical protein